MKTNLRTKNSYKKHQRFCQQQLFGLLHSITLLLKSIRPNKTEIKIIADQILVCISSQVRNFSLHHTMTTAPTPNPLSYHHCWEARFEILLIIANRYCRRNARFPVHSSSSYRKFQKCAASVLIRPGKPTGLTTIEIEEAIHIILTFSLHLDSCVWMSLFIWEPDCVIMNSKWYAVKSLVRGIEPMTLVVPAMLGKTPAHTWVIKLNPAFNLTIWLLLFKQWRM